MGRTKRRPCVKRAYRSPLRDANARATRSAIAHAAAKLFAENGYAPVSVDAVAELAGVSRATVFLVGGKAALLEAAYEAAWAQPAPSAPSEPTARGYVTAYAAVATAAHQRLARIHEALREAASADPDARKLWDKMLEERRRNAATVVAEVLARAPLRRGLDEAHAADAVWAFLDPTWFSLLVQERGWSQARFSAWLSDALARQLLEARD